MPEINFGSPTVDGLLEVSQNTYEPPSDATQFQECAENVAIPTGATTTITTVSAVADKKHYITSIICSTRAACGNVGAILIYSSATLIASYQIPNSATPFGLVISLPIALVGGTNEDITIKVKSDSGGATVGSATLIGYTK